MAIVNIKASSMKRKGYAVGGSVWNSIDISSLSAEEKLQFDGLSTDTEKMNYLTSNPKIEPTISSDLGAPKQGGGIDQAALATGIASAAATIGNAYADPNASTRTKTEGINAGATQVVSSINPVVGGLIAGGNEIGKGVRNDAETFDPNTGKLTNQKKATDTAKVGAFFDPLQAATTRMSYKGGLTDLSGKGYAKHLEEEEKKRLGFDGIYGNLKADEIQKSASIADYRVRAKDGGAISSTKATADENIKAGSPQGLAGLLGQMNPTPNYNKVSQGKEGGQVKGAGTSKSDSIDVNVDAGSFIVPANNASIAQQLREQYLGDPGKQPMKKGGNTPVSLSNGEHMFTPEEVKILEGQGINLAMLAPNAKTGGNGYQMGGSVRKGYSDGTPPGGVEKEKSIQSNAAFRKLSQEERNKILNQLYQNKNVRSYLEGLVYAEASKTNPSEGKNPKSSATGWYQFLSKTHKDIKDLYGKDGQSKNFKEASEAAIALMIDNGAAKDVVNGNFTAADNRLKGVWTSLPGGAEHNQNKWAKELHLVRDAFRTDTTTTLPSGMAYNPKTAINRYITDTDFDSESGTYKEETKSPLIKSDVEGNPFYDKNDKRISPDSKVIDNALASKNADTKNLDKLKKEMEDYSSQRKFIQPGSGRYKVKDENGNFVDQRRMNDSEKAEYKKLKDAYETEKQKQGKNAPDEIAKTRNGIADAFDNFVTSEVGVIHEGLGVAGGIAEHFQDQTERSRINNTQTEKGLKSIRQDPQDQAKIAHLDKTKKEIIDLQRKNHLNEIVGAWTKTGKLPEGVDENNYTEDEITYIEDLYDQAKSLKEGTDYEKRTKDFVPVEKVKTISSSDALKSEFKKVDESARPTNEDLISKEKFAKDHPYFPEKETPITESGGSKIFKSLGGYGGLMALGQTGFGLAGLLGNKEPDPYTPDATLVAMRDKALLDSERMDPAIKAAAERNLELTRRGQNEQIQQVAGGDTGLAITNMRRAGIDKNRAIVDLAAMQEGMKQQKKQFAGGLAEKVAGQNRMAYEDKFNKYMMNQQAASSLMNSGIANFIGATSEAGQQERLDNIDKKYSGTSESFGAALKGLAGLF